MNAGTRIASLMEMGNNDGIRRYLAFFASRALSLRCFSPDEFEAFLAVLTCVDGECTIDLFTSLSSTLEILDILLLWCYTLCSPQQHHPLGHGAHPHDGVTPCCSPNHERGPTWSIV